MLTVTVTLTRTVVGLGLRGHERRPDLVCAVARAVDLGVFDDLAALVVRERVEVQLQRRARRHRQRVPRLRRRLHSARARQRFGWEGFCGCSGGPHIPISGTVGQQRPLGAATRAHKRQLSESCWCCCGGRHCTGARSHLICLSSFARADNGSTSRATRFCGATALIVYSDSCAGLRVPSASDGRLRIVLWPRTHARFVR